jgi:predicted metal-dependent hydrolase
MDVRVIRSRRKTVALQVLGLNDVVVRAPMRMSNREIEEFVQQNMDWIQKNLKKVAENQKEEEEIVPMTEAEVRELAERATQLIPERVKHFAPLVGVTYGRITIRNQKSRWGSCSAKGNLNFNVGLLLAPPEVLDYVVVHELCHRKEMNHSPKFWAEVSKLIPDYKQHEKWLKDNGRAIIKKIRF